MMKKVIFICLLSLTTCLSRPDGTQEAAGTPTVPPNPVSPAAKVPTDPAVAPVVTPAPPASTNITVLPTNPVPTANASTPAPATNTTKPAPEQKPETADDNKTTNKTTSAGDNTTNVTPAVVVPKNETDTGKKNATVVPAHDDKNNATSTPKAEVTTKAPTKPIEVAGRGFDGASFIGGIVLTLGLLAVGFMGFKYYRNQTERNYHTL